MGIKESSGKGIIDWRILAVIAFAAILGRVFISLDKKVVLWESIGSGMLLIILGWFIFGSLYSLSKRETDWIISNKVAQGLAVSVSALNVYVLVYYVMRWYELTTKPEIFAPPDYLLRDLRFAALVLAYCGLIWATGYLKKMHDNYLLVTEKMPGMRKASTAESMFRILTDERTVIVIIGLVFLWRAIISFDKQILPWESMVSGMGLFILGWVLFGYISSLAVRTTRPSVAKIYQGIAFALFAVNFYVLVYYGMRWYRIIYMAASEEALMPLDFVFRDIRYFVLAIFFCTSIVLSKYLERASEECEYLIKKGEKEYKE